MQVNRPGTCGSNFKPFVLCATLRASQYRPTYGQQCHKNGKRKHCLGRTFFKEYSTRFRMVCRLIGFALVVLTLLVFKVCVIIGISKSKFFNFSVTERVTQNQKNLKTIPNIFCFFTETLALFFPVLHWVGYNFDLPSDSNIFKKIGKFCFCHKSFSK